MVEEAYQDLFMSEVEIAHALDKEPEEETTTLVEVPSEESQSYNEEKAKVDAYDLLGLPNIGPVEEGAPEIEATTNQTKGTPQPLYTHISDMRARFKEIMQGTTNVLDLVEEYRQKLEQWKGIETAEELDQHLGISQLIFEVAHYINESKGDEGREVYEAQPRNLRTYLKQLPAWCRSIYELYKAKHKGRDFHRAIYLHTQENHEN